MKKEYDFSKSKENLYATGQQMAEGVQVSDKTKYIYWKDEDMYLGYLDEFPDYMTQGETLDELKENLKDIYKEVTSGNIPAVRRSAELEIA